MKILEKKYILLLLLIIGALFLFAPANKAKAWNNNTYNCFNLVNNKCVEFSSTTATANNDYDAATAQCASICTTPVLGGTWTRDCSWYDGRCAVQIATKVYSCTNNDKCTNKSEDDTQAGEHRIIQWCSDICGVPVDLNHPKNSGCIFSTDPCPPPTTPAPGPLAGASVKELKDKAQSFLNKANFSGPADVINRAIKILLAFIGSISLVLYVWSGFLWMTASGNSDQVGKAKTTMVWTTLGVVMMLASYMLASFIFKSLGL